MKKTIILLFTASLFVLLLFGCSTDISSSVEGGLEMQETAVSKTLTVDEMEALLEKKIITAEEMEAIDATVAAMDTARAVHIIADPQKLRKATGVYNFYCWYHLNQRVNSVFSYMVVHEWQDAGYWLQKGLVRKTRNSVYPGANWDIAIRDVGIRESRGRYHGAVRAYTDSGTVQAPPVTRYF